MQNSEISPSFIADGGLSAVDAVTATRLRERYESLTPRQREVCLMMAEGLLSKQIADRLGSSINTIKTHRTEIFRKMEARSLLDLARMVDALRESRLHAELVPAPVTETLRVPGNTSVLVIEDNDDLRASCVEALSGMGYEADGLPHDEGLAATLQQRRVDIVLLDVGLGEGRADGFEIAARLRASGAIGIIMVTARGERDARIRGLADGADAYLVKPIDFGELDAVIQSVRRRMALAAVGVGRV